MEPRRSKRIKISKEGDFNLLLGALIRELPDVFEAEVLTKLGLKDHFALAQVNKECKDVVYKIPPLQFLRSKCIGFYSAMYCAKSMSTDLSENDVLNPMLGETAKMGRLDVLKWVWELTSSPWHNTLGRGLKYLHDNKCPGWEENYDSHDMHSE